MRWYTRWLLAYSIMDDYAISQQQAADSAISKLVDDRLQASKADYDAYDANHTGKFGIFPDVIDEDIAASLAGQLCKRPEA